MYSPLHYGSESKAPPDGDWERETVSEKLKSKAQDSDEESDRLTLRLLLIEHNKSRGVQYQVVTSPKVHYYFKNMLHLNP